MTLLTRDICRVQRPLDPSHALGLLDPYVLVHRHLGPGEQTQRFGHALVLWSVGPRSREEKHGIPSSRSSPKSRHQRAKRIQPQADNPATGGRSRRATREQGITYSWREHSRVGIRLGIFVGASPPHGASDCTMLLRWRELGITSPRQLGRHAGSTCPLDLSPPGRGPSPP